MGSLTADMDAMELDAPIDPNNLSLDTFTKYADDQPGDALPFYEAEGRTLALWDRLNELKLEISLMEAQANPPEEEPLNKLDLEATLKEAERECLEARAAYTLKQSIVDDVLIADPILKAVHSGANASPTERSLRPLIDRRDILSITSTNFSSILQRTLGDKSKAEVDNLRTMRKNRDLAATLDTLAREVETSRSQAIATSAHKDRLNEEEEESVEARKRWRIMKSVVAAVVVGSGIDWARDDTLRDLVLDGEDKAD